MATIKPFAALRPQPDLAPRICELPYDVMSTDEARQIAAGNPLSFLHVSKPEIDLPPATDPYAPAVYAKGRENFRSLIEQGALRQDPQPHFYLYRQVMGAHSQTGLVAAASCEDYLKGIVKKHELTRVDKEDDRVRHIEALESQTGPVFLVYRATAEMDALVAKQTAHPPSVDFTAPDGVQHTAWVIADPAQAGLIEAEFARMPCLYIADGHHRSAAAARVYQTRKGTGESGCFLSVIFPHNQMQILPYNRVLKDLNGLSPAQLLEKLATVFEIRNPGAASPSHKHQLGLYLPARSADNGRASAPASPNSLEEDQGSRGRSPAQGSGQWHTLTFLPRFTAAADPIEQLDVTLLQKHVLEPLFGITDPRTSKRINFVGGIRGTAELEKLVDAGDYACAFSMFPTSIEDLMAIADAGGIMPPKSTWFEPKLRDAMFCHMI
jgi:uncharacterized protein (DUF1015 family)